MASWQFRADHQHALNNGKQWLSTDNEQHWKVFEESLKPLQHSSYDMYREGNVCDRDPVALLLGKVFGPARAKEQVKDATRNAQNKEFSIQSDTLWDIGTKSNPYIKKPNKKAVKPLEGKGFTVSPGDTPLHNTHLDADNRNSMKRARLVERKLKRARKPHSSIRNRQTPAKRLFRIG